MDSPDCSDSSVFFIRAKNVLILTIFHSDNLKTNLAKNFVTKSSKIFLYIHFTRNFQVQNLNSDQNNEGLFVLKSNKDHKFMKPLFVKNARLKLCTFDSDLRHFLGNTP